MSKQITTGMRIEAKRIGCKPTELGGGNLADARKIDRAITAAVRKERGEKSQDCHDTSVTKTRLQKRRVIDDDEEVSTFSDEQMRQRVASLRHRPDWLPPGKPWVSEPMARNLARNPRLTAAILESAAKVAKEGRNTLKNPAGCFIAEIQKALSAKEAA